MDYCKFFELHNIEFQKGLNTGEFAIVEKIYNIKFPFELKKMLRQALPVSTGFYNWRNLSSENINNIKQMIEMPCKSAYEYASEVEWNCDWGDKPSDTSDIERMVRSKLTCAPTLIPVFAHRYIPMIEERNIPVISVHGIDIVYCGTCLDDYLEIEFADKKLKDFLSEYKTIPFWSEIM